MRPALTRIEQLLTRQRSPDIREPMLAIYLLWHRLTPPEVHQQSPDATLNAAVVELQRPSMYSFAISVLLELDPGWTMDEWCELAEDRYEELKKNRPVALPARLDSSLWLCVAQLLQSEGESRAACDAIGRAIDCSPGDPVLIAMEGEAASGRTVDTDVREFLLALAV